MIRDPSDGSVKEIPEPVIPVSMTGVIPAILSGLPPTSAKAAYLARLERSHKWLKDYHAKAAAHPVEAMEEAK